MNKTKDFVNKYKDIFTTKSAHIPSHSKKKILIDIVKLMAIITALAVIIGYLTNTFENLSYVVYIIHTIFLGSFIIYFYIIEVKNKNRNEDLNPIIISLISVLPLISVILLSNGIFFATYLREVSPIFNVYLFIILGSLLYIALLLFSEIRIIHNEKIYLDAIFNIAASLLIYVGIFRTLPFTNINVSYIIASSFIYFIFIINKNLSFYNTEVKYKLIFKIVFLALLFTIYFRFRIGTDYLKNEEFILTDFKVSSSVLVEDITITSFSSSEDYYILKGHRDDSWVYQIYDFNFNLKKELSIEYKDYLYEYEGDFYLVNQVYNGELSMITHTIKTLDHNFEIVNEELLNFRYSDSLFLYGENQYAFVGYDYSKNRTYFTIFDLLENTSYELHREDYEHNEVIYKSKTSVIFTLNSKLYYISEKQASPNHGGEFISNTRAFIYYSNDYIIIKEDGKSTIVPFDDFINNDHDNELVINDDTNGLYFDDTYLYILKREDNYNGLDFDIYDIDYNLINSIDVETSWYSSTYLFSEYEILNNQIIYEEDNTLYFVDIDDPETYYVNQNLNYQDRFKYSSLLLLGVTLASSSVIFLRGDKHE